MYEIGLNQIWQYIVFALFIFLTVPLGKLVHLLFKAYLNRVAIKTQTKFDEILISALNPTITLFILAFNFYFAILYIDAGQYTEALARVFNFLIIIPLVFFSIKFSTGLIGYYLKGGRNSLPVNEAAVDLVTQVVNIALLVVGILLILANLGYNISALLAGLGVGGLAFALAAQDLLKNFFAGVSLVFDQTFRKGERITFSDTTGFIEELRLRSTKIRTFDGSLLTVPNSLLAGDVVENITQTPKVRVSMVIGVTYDTPTKKLKKAKEIIQNILKEHKEVDETMSWIYFDNFGDYSLNIQVLYRANWLTMNDWPDRVYMKDEVNFAIKEQFEKAGISIALPTQTIELKPNELSK